MLRILYATTALVASAALATAQEVEVAPLTPAEELMAAAAAEAAGDDVTAAQVAAQGLGPNLSAADLAAQGFVFRTSPSPMVPFQRGVAAQVFASGVFDDEYLIPKLGGALPVYQGDLGQVTLWGEGFGSFAIDDGDDAFGGSVGPVWRQRLDQNNAVGLNVFVDAATDEDAEDVMVQFGAGAEYEHILDLADVETVRFGINGYVPLEDYTDIGDFGTLDRAPQLGGDAYVRYGVDVNEGFARLDLTLGGFGYAAGDQSDELFGGVATVGLTIWEALPEGMALSGYVGPRYATGGEGGDNEDEAIDVIGGLKLSYSFGGARNTTRQVTTQPRFDPPRDCVVARDAQGNPVYDCTRPVLSGRGGRAKTGETIREQIPAPQPRVETVNVVVPGAAPVEPIRHIGYGTLLSPVAR